MDCLAMTGIIKSVARPQCLQRAGHRRQRQRARRLPLKPGSRDSATSGLRFGVIRWDSK